MGDDRSPTTEVWIFHWLYKEGQFSHLMNAGKTCCASAVPIDNLSDTPFWDYTREADSVAMDQVPLEDVVLVIETLRTFLPSKVLAEDPELQVVVGRHRCVEVCQNRSTV